MHYREEYPRPQFERKEWMNLNGAWEFEIDNAENGMEHRFYEKNTLANTINVPFCPDSSLSGVGNTDFMNCVWYRKNIEIPSEWSGRRVLLHFGAIDYKATVFVNGKKVGTHKGGYTPFSFDITDFLGERDNFITVCAVDHLREENQPSGKQSRTLHSHGCY